MPATMQRTNEEVLKLLDNTKITFELSFCQFAMLLSSWKYSCIASNPEQLKLYTTMLHTFRNHVEKIFKENPQMCGEAKTIFEDAIKFYDDEHGKFDEEQKILKLAQEKKLTEEEVNHYLANLPSTEFPKKPSSNWNHGIAMEAEAKRKMLEKKKDEARANRKGPIVKA